ncbi:DNA-directed RNA polymerase II core subunit [Malassezia sp. CBS 17886]|nr:DNA-directed RNA polymerase II core subunit [Malassezia sp. CBS 17886]
MANAPDRFTLFLLQPGERRIEVQEDMRVPNAATFYFNKEDHTLGNMLRHAVLSVPGVLFCGYKVPHPLEPRVLVKIQTDGTQTPAEVLQHACTKMIVDIGTLKQAWAKELRLSADGTGNYPASQLWGTYPAQAPAQDAPPPSDAYAHEDRPGGDAIRGYVDI